MSKLLRFVAIPAAIIAFACRMWAADDQHSFAPEPAQIVDRYVAATQLDRNVLEGSMDVDISASVPQLKEQGLLHASRRISKLGRITYRVLGFQGDRAVKNEVIARYLEAEQRAHDLPNLTVTPANYKLKFRGERTDLKGHALYIFEVAPRRKRVGLFKGEMWLDANTFLPVYEKGRLVKSPSIFFKRVEFERAYDIQNGLAVPEHMSSSIETRLVGRVELNVKYSNFAPSMGTSGNDSEGTSGSNSGLP